MADSVELTERIAASPDAIYRLVSDLPRMGEWSPEASGGKWVGGATGATPGAKFAGVNKNGIRRWSTTATINEAVSGERLAFTISVAGIDGARWSYVLVPDGDATLVTERWQDLRPRRLLRVLGWATGVADRTTFTERSIRQTLTAIKREAESATAG